MRKAWLAGIVIAAGCLFAAAPLRAQAKYLDYGDPTPGEQHVLELINRARANPPVEGARLASFNPPLPGGDITEGLPNPGNVGPRPPLAMNFRLLSTARAHSFDMWDRDYFAHNSPAPVTSPGSRATAAGYTWNRIGENIAASSGDTEAWLEDFLMVDWLDSSTPIANRGHRANLLDADNAGNPFREVGIGFYHDNTPNGDGFRDFLTQDFGRRNSGGPFIVGAVYNDANDNSFFDFGETGIAGVTIGLDPAGAFECDTASAGGYAFPVGTSGTVTIRPVGGIAWPASVVKRRTLTGENRKVDFRTSEATDTDGDGMPDAWETANSFDPATPADALLDADNDGATNKDEFQFSSNPRNAGSTPANPEGGAAPPSPPPDDDDDSGGLCGSTGLDLLWPVALLWMRRRLNR